MDFAYTLHRIIMQTIAIEPRTVLPVTDAKNFAELLLLGAIREATSAEIALFKMSNPDIQAAAAEAAAAEAAAAEAAAAEAAAAEAAAAEAAAAEGKLKGKPSKNLID